MVEHNQSSYYNNGYKFNGKELDEATGMYYYGARYYDPRISIFISVDPLAEQTFEPYSYTGNNPIMFTDPTGMSKDDIEITDSSGNHLFTLDDGKKEITTMTVKELYDNKTQWFEPEGDNYIPLKVLSLF